jgi:hypothetical protein
MKKRAWGREERHDKLCREFLISRVNSRAKAIVGINAHINRAGTGKSDHGRRGRGGEERQGDERRERKWEAK